jgi:predicted nucleic-acid-binding protein
MKAVDTNILVRFLVGDDEAQARKVYSLFKTAEDRGESFHVPLIVILEMIWVLESVYEIPRKGIIESIGDLLASTVLHSSNNRQPFKNLSNPPRFPLLTFPTF